MHRSAIFVIFADSGVSAKLDRLLHADVQLAGVVGTLRGVAAAGISVMRILLTGVLGL